MEISDFEVFLDQVGLKRIRFWAPENAMGYIEIEYASEGICVKLTKEKGYWDARIAGPALAPEKWYFVKLFTYLLGGKPQPDMPLGEELDYAKKYWEEIIRALSREHIVKTLVRLDAASKERAQKGIQHLADGSPRPRVIPKTKWAQMYFSERDAVFS